MLKPMQIAAKAPRKQPKSIKTHAKHNNPYAQEKKEQEEEQDFSQAAAPAMRKHSPRTHTQLRSHARTNESQSKSKSISRLDSPHQPPIKEKAKAKEIPKAKVGVIGGPKAKEQKEVLEDHNMEAAGNVEELISVATAPVAKEEQAVET
jgi:hypothetical protein